MHIQFANKVSAPPSLPPSLPQKPVGGVSLFGGDEESSILTESLRSNESPRTTKKTTPTTKPKFGGGGLFDSLTIDEADSGGLFESTNENPADKPQPKKSSQAGGLFSDEDEENLFAADGATATMATKSTPPTETK